VVKLLRKKNKITAMCKDCGCKPEPDKEKSNENWKVIPVKCSKCGGKIVLDLGFGVGT